MKIAVPWPIKKTSQPRIREALELWADKKLLLLCMVEPCNDDFLKGYDTCVLPRNSLSIGTKVAKPFIYDMMKMVVELFPGEDYYGFGNSDCVPVGNIIEGWTDREVLIYHRTDIREWEYRFKDNAKKCINLDLADKIWEMRQSGIDDRKLARHLNLKACTPPPGEQEWTYLVVRKLFEDQGFVFFWGQDLYLFRNDAVGTVMSNYLSDKDPVLGTGGFDPRLTKWLMDNLNSVRVINKIFHKMHESEWNADEVEYRHNGGDIPVEDQINYYDENLVLSLCENGQKGAIPKYIRYMLENKDPKLKAKLEAHR
jgi:hypothetical protein